MERMMYSGKPPPLKSFSNGTTLGSKDASPGAVAAVMQQLEQLQGTSENCDPNHPTFSVGGRKGEVVRKAEASPVLDDVQQSAGNANAEALPPPKLHQVGEGVECESIPAAGNGELGRESKEVSRPVEKKSSLPSPTKGSVGGHNHQHGQGPRHHFCRSPRCASNNPDWATPTQPTPRKYLVSKRHLLPGAICSKDPAVLAAQESAASLLPPPAPSTGKPPKPSRNNSNKLDNALRQPSFATVCDRSPPPPLAYETSPTRIPKPPSSRSPVPKILAAECSPLQRPSAAAISLPATPAEEPRSPSSLPAAAQERQAPVEGSLGDVEDRQERLPELDAGSERLTSLGSAVEPLSPRASDFCGSPGVSLSGDDDLLGSCVTFAGDDEPLTQLASPPTSPVWSDVADSQASEQLSPEASSSPGQPSAGVEDVTQRLAQKLAFEDVEENSFPLVDFDHKEEFPEIPEIPAADALEGWMESKEDSSRTGESGTEVQFSKSDDALRFADEEYDEAFQGVMNNTGGGDCLAEKNADGGDCQAEKNSDGGDCEAEKILDGGDCEAEKNADGGVCEAERDEFGEGHRSDKNSDGEECQAEWKEFAEDCQTEENADGEGYQFGRDALEFDNTPSPEDTEGQEERQGIRSIASYIEELESAQSKQPQTERHGEAPKFVRGKGRQLWRSDCRDSREVVFLKQTPEVDRRDGDWMVDSILEGAISKLNPSGQGRVRVLVEAFESLLHLGGDSSSSERRASRVWCLNRMERGEVDEDGEEFEDGDQRVDCYEVSGEGLQLRASMRLSLGGGSRLPLYNPDEVDEIEMSAIQKVQDWDDDCRESSTLERLGGESLRSQSQHDEAVAVDQENRSEGPSDDSELAFGALQRRISFTESHTVQNGNDRSSEEDFNCDARTESQVGCYTRDGGQQRNDTRSTFSLNLDCKHRTSRRRRHWKANPVNLEPSEPSLRGGGAAKQQRAVKGTNLEPFRLLTEERGMMKEYQFAKKLEQMFAEEEQLRNPIAQGLPWTTDEKELVPKPAVKEKTQPVEFRHFSNSRAIERAEFDSYVSERAAYVDMCRQEEERARLIADEEEIKRLRREMVPRAQLMPFFDQPFIPTRSSKRLTVPKEPTFLNRQHKRAKCIVWQQHQHQHQQVPAPTYDRPHVFN